mmetsp:Transcript_90794/g.282881  ORF Transcript_90794/g.282881 Transcript_90794/m.282881 type:complete len:431 (-) Transcript_90794:46-1338(-)
MPKAHTKHAKLATISAVIVAVAAFHLFPYRDLILVVGGPLMQMRLFPNDPSTQIKGCQMLAGIAGSSPPAKVPLMWLGGMDACARAVRRFPSDKSLQGSCLNCLGMMSLFSRKTSVYAGTLGAPQLTVQAMRTHNMAMGGTLGCFNDFCPENRVRMRLAGGVKLMLEQCGVNGTHYWDAKAQLMTWCGFSSFHDKDNLAEFRELGGIESSVQIMKDHPKSYRVREEVLMSTKGTAAKAAYRIALVEAGFLDILLQSLKEDSGDPQIVALGFESLRLFVESNESVRMTVARMGFAEEALAALQVHSSALLNTRAGHDKQHVYGTFNDEMYNVPGAATGVLSALVLAGAELQEHLLDAGVVDQLATSMAVTRGRVPEQRTWFGSCATLEVLRRDGRANASLASQMDQVFSSSRCSTMAGQRPPVAQNFVWEP